MYENNRSAGAELRCLLLFVSGMGDVMRYHAIVRAQGGGTHRAGFRQLVAQDAFVCCPNKRLDVSSVGAKHVYMEKKSLR